MATSNDLMQDVYANFLSAYAHSTGAGNTVIAFEPAGLSPGIDPASAGSKAATLEYVSNEADAVPDLSSGSYERTMRTISFTYGTTLSSAVSVTTSDGFNSLKAGAVEMFHNFSLGSANGPTTFKPAYAAPADWFDISHGANWLSYRYNAGTPAITPTPATSRPPMAIPIWRLMRTQGLMAPSDAVSAGAAPAAATQAVASQIAASHAIAATIPQASLGVHALNLSSANAMLHVNMNASTMASAASTEPGLMRLPSMAVSKALVSDRITIDPAMFHIEPLIVNNDGDHPVLQPQFSIAFDYCIVQLSRPWYSGDFLSDSEWYLPGKHAGDLASGPHPAPAANTNGASTGQGAQAAAQAVAPNTGYFAWLPVAFIAVKNLSVHLAGGALDASVTKSVASFGPFSFAPGSSSDSLVNPGIEIIGWVCSAQPQLPPQTDPALVPAPVATDPISKMTAEVTDVINTLTNLFSGKH